MSIIYSLSSGDLLVNHTIDEHPQPNNFLMHTHTCAELYHFISGNGIYHIEGNEYPLQSGDILLMRPGESHYIEIKSDTPYERVVISFPIDLFKGIDPENDLLQPLFNRKSGKLNLYKSYEFDGNFHSLLINKILLPVENQQLQIISNLIPLLSEICRIFSGRSTENSEDTPEYRLVRYINKNISSSLNLDILCKKFFMSKQQLCRVFKKSTGTTVWKYITVKRLIKAHKMISEGAKPTKVFSEVGFNDYSTFYRAYVKEFGFPPAHR